MKRKAIWTFLGLAALLAVGLWPAVATAEQNVPGSLLVYPYVDTSVNSPTVISITNTYLFKWGRIMGMKYPAGYSPCVPGDPDSTRYGDTAVHFIFFDKDECLEQNFDLFMTPGDHATFLASDELPEGQVGWMVAFAVDPEFPSGEVRPWNFDFLVGQAHVVESGFDMSWTYNPYAFLSGLWDRPYHNGGEGPICGKFYLEGLAGGNSNYLNFNGTEYEEWPDELYLPRFYEEAGGGEVWDSLLALISPNSTRVVERDYIFTYSILFFNNDEVPFSKTRNFQCMDVTSLHEISAMFEDLGGIDDVPEQPTGWAIFDGYLYRKPSGELVMMDAPLLGVFAQKNNTGIPGQKVGGGNFFTRGFNCEEAYIQYIFD